MSPRFVLRYRGDGDPDDDLRRLAERPGVRVVDRSGRMVLVEGEEQALGDLREAFADWVMTPEQTIRVPDTRKQVHRPPG